MEQEEKERLERGAIEELNRRCGDGTVQKVEMLQYGDEPVIEPGQAMVRVILTPAGEDPEETLHAFYAGRGAGGAAVPPAPAAAHRRRTRR